MTDNQRAILFTAENAREMAHRGVAARKAKSERLAAAEAALKAIPVPTPLSERIARLERQMNQLDDMLDKCKVPRDMVALTQAKERLLNAWSLLTGFPRPGVRRHSARRNGMPMPQPVEQSEPEPVAEPAIQTQTTDVQTST